MVASELQLSMNVKLSFFINLPNKYFTFASAFYRSDRKRETKWQHLSVANPLEKEEKLLCSLLPEDSAVVTLLCCIGCLAAQCAGITYWEMPIYTKRLWSREREKWHRHTIKKEQKHIFKKKDYKLQTKPSVCGLWETQDSWQSPSVRGKGMLECSQAISSSSSRLLAWKEPTISACLDS